MLKRMTTLLTLLLILPAFAHAWDLTAKTREGGAISPPGTTVGLTDGLPATVTIDPADGYSVDYLQIGNTRIDLAGLTDVGDGTYTYDVSAPTGDQTKVYVTAFFTTKNSAADIALDITGFGGIREKNKKILTDIPTTEARTLVIAPRYGYAISSYGAATTAGGTLVTPTSDTLNGNGTRELTFAGGSITEGITVSASFVFVPSITANAGPNITIPVGAIGTLDGRRSRSNTGAITYAWTADEGLDITSPSAAYTEVSSAAAGTYTATLTITNTATEATYTDTATVTVTAPATGETADCLVCHQWRNPDLNTTHGVASVNALDCSSCHDLDDLSDHYSTRYPKTNDSLGFDGATDPMAQHFDGSALTLAQYVSVGVTCADCHANADLTANTSILSNFANSGHGDTTGEAWMHYDWRASNRAACQRCHTSAGYVDKLGNEVDTTNVFTDNDVNLAGGVLDCATCHTDLESGALRAAGAFSTNYTNNGGYIFPDVGASNLCVACHSGRENGDTIKLATGDFSNQSFYNSHYLIAAGPVFARGGYEYAGQDYDMGAHHLIGVDNAAATGEAGPCVTCHMGIDSADHSWNVVTKDESGIITAINSNACVNCHTDLDAATLESKKETFEDYLHDLKLALDAKGIYYASSYPYFFTVPEGGYANALKDWTLGGTMDGKDVMGAAFNYGLLHHEPGAFAHNSGYALKLIADSIDFLADGVVDGSGIVTIDSVPTDVTAQIITGQMVRDDVATCGACHTSQETAWANSNHANDIATASPSSGLRKYDTEAKTQAEADAGADVRSCQVCHAPNWEAPAGADLAAASIPGMIGCAGCHTEGSHPTDARIDALTTCGSCHDRSIKHDTHGANMVALVTASKHADNSYPTTREGTARCQMCHTTEGFVAFAADGVGDADRNHNLDSVTALPVFDAAGNQIVQDTACSACHDPHTGNMRAVAGWDPNGNGDADQFDLCTACHTYYNQNGVLIGSGENGTAEYYHNTAWYRTIPTTHYDNPATTDTVEGYVVRKDSASPCFDCHGHELRTNTRYATTAAPVEDPDNPDYGPTIYTEWAMSGHAGGLLNAKYAADPDQVRSEATVNAVMAAGASDDTSNGGYTHYDWDASNRQSCQKCHTSTGFVNYAADPETYDATNNDFSHLSGWANNEGTITSSGQNELLYCWGCHSNAETGDLRVSGAVTADYTFGGVAVQFPDLGSSNTCVVCHAGRGNNETVSTSSRFAGHHAPAAATLYNTLSHVGGEFAGQDYANPVYFKHDLIGTAADTWTGDTTSGSCVVCHMEGANHEFAVVEKDDAGVINGINSDACYACHTGAYGAALVTEDLVEGDGTAAAAAAFLEHESESYQEAGAILQALVSNTITNYTDAVVDQSNAVDNDRRAFQNAKISTEDKGGFAHNRYYVKRLIFDSIDWLEDGIIDGTIGDYSATYPDGAAWLGTTRP